MDLTKFKTGQGVYVIEFGYNDGIDIETAVISKELFLAECDDYIFLTDFNQNYKNIDEWLESMYNEGLAEYCVSDITMAKKEHVFATNEEAEKAMIKILEEKYG